MLKKGRINHMIMLEEKVVREDVETIILKVARVGIIKVINMIFTMFVEERMDMIQRNIGSNGRILKKIRKKKKKKKVNLLNPLILLLYTIILV